MPDRPLVTNASNVKQIQKAQKRAAYNETRDREEMQKLLALPEFRRYIWHLLAYCGVHESVFETSAKIYYNAGQQDVGHKIEADIMAAQPRAYIQMMEEHDA